MARPKTIIIDGSNAVHAIFGSWPGTREDQNRYASDLVARLSAWAAAHSDTDIEIVFDGAFRPLKDAPAANLRILFSDHDSADRLIVERARAVRFYGKKATVVTWDRELAERAREEEAKIMDPQRFWDTIR